MIMIIVLLIVIVIMMEILAIILIMRVAGWFCEVTGPASSWHASPCLPITSRHHHCHHVITIITVLFVVPVIIATIVNIIIAIIYLVIITCMDNILKYYFILSELLPRIMSKPRINSKPSQGQNVKLKTENLVLKSKFSGQSKTESNTTGGLSPPYSNPSNSPDRQVRTELTK